MLPNELAMFSSALRKKQALRLPWIVEMVNKQPYDVIVFQEVFDRQMHRRLREGIAAEYPHQVQPHRKRGKATGNGILIASRLPIKELGFVIYKESVGIDGMAAKGCTLIEGEKEGMRFQIAGTHLQSGSREKEQTARQSQYEEIAALIKTHENPQIPQFVMGDMNTERSIDVRYQAMLKTLNVQDFPLNEATPYTVDGNNSWTPKNTPEQIDYILLQPHKTATSIVSQKVLRPRMNHKGKTIDYADHYGIEAVVELGNWFCGMNFT